MAAWATSAEVHGPVELQLNGSGQLCAHVRPGSPNEAKQGWSVQLWAAHDSPPLWLRDVDGGAAMRTWPDAPVRCVVVPTTALGAGQPYTVEISSIRLYRSRFCWKPAAPESQVARLLAVDEDSGRCTEAPWVGQDGHALSTRGWWDAWKRWWRP